MQKRLLMICVCLNMLAVLTAQQYEQISTKYLEVSKDGNSGEVLLKFTLLVPSGSVKANDILTLTPILVGSVENEQAAFLPMRVFGRVSARSMRRKQVLGKVTVNVPFAFACHNADTLVYSSLLPYQSWMQNASLVMRRQLRNCCWEEVLPAHELYTCSFNEELPPPMVVQQPKPVLVLGITERLAQVERFVEPIENYVPQKRISVGAQAEAQIIYFKVDKSEIDNSYSDNETVLRHVVEVTHQIQKDPEAEIVRIVLLGLSSPEGRYDYNHKLAGERSKALKKYITDHIVLPDSCFELVNGGEGWEELRYQVSQSEMSDKAAVLQIIDNVPIFKGRESRLLNLKQGVPYRYMKKNFFPQLRRAGYIKVYYRKIK